MNRTATSKSLQKSKAADSLPKPVPCDTTKAALDAAMKRKGLTMDTSAWRRRK